MTNAACGTWRALTLLVLVALACGTGEALAQASPFGVAPPEQAMRPGDGPLAGAFGWIAARQGELYGALSGLVRAFRTDPSAGWMLIALSFAYGVLHAAGPGHGKVVISSYLVATGETLRRGVLVSFAAALAQAATAIAVVGVFALALNATSAVMTRATAIVETASYALVALIGLWLVAAKGAALLRLRVGAPEMVIAGHSHDHRHHHHHEHHHHGHDAACCGHRHAPTPQEMAGPMSLGRAAGAVLAVGLRPCTGALLVLVFALSQGVFALGVAATLAMAAGTGLTVAALAGLAVGARGLAVRLANTGSGRGLLVVRALEFLAALAVLALGVLLLGGALAR